MLKFCPVIRRCASSRRQPPGVPVAGKSHPGHGRSCSRATGAGSGPKSYFPDRPALTDDRRGWHGSCNLKPVTDEPNETSQVESPLPRLRRGQAEVARRAVPLGRLQAGAHRRLTSDWAQPLDLVTHSASLRVIPDNPCVILSLSKDGWA